MEASDNFEAIGDEPIPTLPGTSRKVGATKRKSSLFHRARMSFVRSGGQRGASMETLRGTNGADFEGKAEKVERGNGTSIGCGCFGSAGSDNDVIILIKGPFCFVYSDDKAPAPKFAISLSNLKASVQQPSHGHFPVTLQTLLGDVEYQILFSEKVTAELFSQVVCEQASAGETEMIKKRLGHEHLLSKRASVRYAESIAMKKVGDQPCTPVTGNDLISVNPVPVF